MYSSFLYDLPSTFIDHHVREQQRAHKLPFCGFTHSLYSFPRLPYTGMLSWWWLCLSGVCGAYGCVTSWCFVICSSAGLVMVMFCVSGKVTSND